MPIVCVRPVLINFRVILSRGLYMDKTRFAPIIFKSCFLKFVHHCMIIRVIYVIKSTISNQQHHDA